MNRGITDKVAAWLKERGERGATTDELAELFLRATSAPAFAEKLLVKALAGDSRILRRPDGTWAVAEVGEAPAHASAFTVLETAEAATATGRVIVEWAAVRCDLQGRAGETLGSPIRPEPGPPGLIAPEHLRDALRSAPDYARAVASATDFARGSTVVAFTPGVFHEAVRADECALLSLKKLARKLGADVAKTQESLASFLGIPAREPATAVERAAFTAEMLAALLASQAFPEIGEPEEWIGQQETPRLDVDFSGYEFDREILEQLPERPGIYIMRDANGGAIYVGKATNLRQRVNSYFRRRVQRDEKTEQILEAVSRLEFKEVGSELAALLAEQEAIRRLQPRINVQFDVHDRPAAAKSPHRRIVVVLPAPDPEDAELFLLHGDRAMNHVTLPRTKPEKARPLLKKFFFGPKPPAEQGQPEASDLQIAWSWVERNRDRANVFDVDLAGGLDESLRLLARYLTEGAGEGRVIHI